MDKDFRKDCIERFENGYVYDREVLTILLSNAFPALDAGGIVDSLLYSLPSVYAVLEADLATLMAVHKMTRQVAEYIVALGKAKRISLQPLTAISDSRQLIEYGMDKYRGSDCEETELFCVNRGGKVIAHYTYGSDQMKKVELNFRTVAADITSVSASGFYLLHNHVYGSVQPSEQDDIFTLKLLSVFSEGDIKLIDHCIVGEREGFSYLNSGRLKLLKERLK
ncbi:MAG: JAB domain-containing protein [Candidatus Coproplasma sp.]